VSLYEWARGSSDVAVSERGCVPSCWLCVIHSKGEIRCLLALLIVWVGACGQGGLLMLPLQRGAVFRPAGCV